MSREWQSYLGDVKAAANKVLVFTAGMSRDSFLGKVQRSSMVPRPWLRS